MALRRFFGFVDIGVLALVAVTLFLPAREMYASEAIKGDPFALGLAEARTIARPGDGAAAEDFTRKLGEANMKDWAIEASVRMSDRAKDSPTRWRALIATSVAFIEKVDVKPALEYANQALAACVASRAKDPTSCPTYEEVRMQIYQQHLDAGIQSGIDPKVNPRGFREAGEKAIRYFRVGHRPTP